MRYLALALIREGSTDERFLVNLILRLVEDICLQYASERIDFSEILDLSDRDQSYYSRTNEKHTRTAIEAKDYFDILFIHTDGAGDPVGAYDTRIVPISQGIRETLGDDRHKVVGVVPVKEMEAWALADGDALRLAFSCTLTNDQLDVPPRPRMVEAINDPKAILQKCHMDSRGGRRSRRRQGSSSAFLDRIGEEVSLYILRQVPAFTKFETDLCQALEDLHIIDLSTKRN